MSECDVIQLLIGNNYYFALALFQFQVPMQAIKRIPLQEIIDAQLRLEGRAMRTPLIPYAPGGQQSEIYLKLENLQPIGSFKIRGAGNALLKVPAEQLTDGVYTASAGNMAQGVAFCAREMQIPCVVLVPEHAPTVKLEAIRKLGATYRKLPFTEWWQVMMEHHHPDARGHFIHPVSNPDVIAGNGTIGLEILEDLPDVESIFVPFGGGGLSCGIASAVKSGGKKGTGHCHRGRNSCTIFCFDGSRISHFSTAHRLIC